MCRWIAVSSLPKTGLLASLIWSAFVTLPCPAAAQTGVVLTRSPYLQLVTSNSVIVRWRTDVAVGNVLRYGTNRTALDHFLTNTTPTTEHLVQVTSLLPETRYYYSIETLTNPWANGSAYYWETYPTAGTPRAMRIWVLGDSGRANAAARSVRDAYATWTGIRRTTAMLMLGDNAYEDGTDAEMQATIFGQYASFLRSICLWPTLGNHDTADSTTPPANLPHFVNWSLPTLGEAGGKPSGTERYFSFNIANVHFVCLDSMSSDRSATGPMAKWLKEDLTLNTLDWVVAYWHHPPYSRGVSPSDTTTESTAMRMNFGPILEAGGVDLVLSGHSHSYERSFFIDRHYGTSTTLTPSMKIDGGNGRETGDGAYFKLGGSSPHLGTVYAVVGSSSQADNAALNHPVMAVSMSVLGSMVLDFDGTRLDARFLDSAGAVRDWFTILKTAPQSALITQQPASQAVEPGEAATFTIKAVCAHPLTYQWRRNGATILNATNTSFTVSNVQETDEGSYDVLVHDGISTLASNPAYLSLRLAPLIVRPMVDLSVAAGGSFTLSIETRGTLPMSYRWRRGTLTLTNMTLWSHRAFLTISNAQLIDQGNYTVVLTNDVFYLPGLLSPRATVTILADGDGDQLPDVWEVDNGFDPVDSTDAMVDADGDRQSLLEEYWAGTDPKDASSHLRITEITRTDGVTVQFLASSNRTYSVQYKDRVADIDWRKLTDVVAGAADRMETIIDHAGGTKRYYRLRTPREP